MSERNRMSEDAMFSLFDLLTKIILRFKIILSETTQEEQKFCKQKVRIGKGKRHFSNC